MRDYFACKHICALCACMVPSEVRRGDRALGTIVTKVVNYHVDAEVGTQVHKDNLSTGPL